MLTVMRSLPVQQIRLLVFDLDGTLIDSREDLCKAVNATLVDFDRQPLPEAIIASYIGDGAGMLVRRALGDPSDESLVARALAAFMVHYRRHKLDHTYVYAGVLESLAALQNKLKPVGEHTMAILTNKPITPTLAICEALGLSPYFFRIYGGDSFATKKPDPEGLLALMREAQAEPHETLMVGDSDVDMLTAQRAGAWSMGCRYGLSPEKLATVPADILVDTATEWVEAVQASCARQRSGKEKP